MAENKAESLFLDKKSKKSSQERLTEEQIKLLREIKNEILMIGNATGKQLDLEQKAANSKDKNRFSLGSYSPQKLIENWYKDQKKHYMDLAKSISKNAKDTKKQVDASITSIATKTTIAAIAAPLIVPAVAAILSAGPIYKFFTNADKEQKSLGRAMKTGLATMTNKALAAKNPFTSRLFKNMQTHGIKKGGFSTMFDSVFNSIDDVKNTVGKSQKTFWGNVAESAPGALKSGKNAFTSGLTSFVPEGFAEDIKKFKDFGEKMFGKKGMAQLGSMKNSALGGKVSNTFNMAKTFGSGQMSNLGDSIESLVGHGKLDQTKGIFTQLGKGKFSGALNQAKNVSRGVTNSLKGVVTFGKIAEVGEDVSKAVSGLNIDGTLKAISKAGAMGGLSAGAGLASGAAKGAAGVAGLLGKKVLGGVGKGLLKSLPVIGGVFSIMSGVDRWKKGGALNKSQAIMDFASGAMNFIPVAWPFALAMDMANLGIDMAKMAMPEFSAGTAVSSVMKMAGKSSLKALKRFPLIGSIISIPLAMERWNGGDKLGALIEGASGLANLVPGLGMPISLALDLMNLGKDFAGMGLGADGGNTAMNAGVKIGAKLGLSFLKKIPMLGSIISIPLAINRWKSGDKLGALIEAGSGIANLFPGLGTPIAIGLDLLNMGRDAAGDMSPETKGGFKKLGTKFLEGLPLIGTFIRGKRAMKLWKEGNKGGAIWEGVKAFGTIIPGMGWMTGLAELAAEKMDKIDESTRDKPNSFKSALLRNLPIIGTYMRGKEAFALWKRGDKHGAIKEGFKAFGTLIPGFGLVQGIVDYFGKDKPNSMKDKPKKGKKLTQKQLENLPLIGAYYKVKSAIKLWSQGRYLDATKKGFSALGSVTGLGAIFSVFQSIFGGNENKDITQMTDSAASTSSPSSGGSSSGSSSTGSSGGSGGAGGAGGSKNWKGGTHKGSGKSGVTKNKSGNYRFSNTVDFSSMKDFTGTEESSAGTKSAGEYSLSPAGFQFIKGAEKYHPTPFWDYKQWSWGYGTKVPGSDNNPDNNPGGTISEPDAAAAADKAMSTYTGGVKQTFKDELLTQSQFDALTSFAYNLGPGWLPTIHRGWKTSGAAGAANNMQKFNKAGDPLKVLDGLTKRRQREGDMMFMANGGIATEGLLTGKKPVVAGEAGPEAIIPLNGQGINFMAEAINKAQSVSSVKNAPSGTPTVNLSAATITALSEVMKIMENNGMLSGSTESKASVSVF